MRDFRNAKVMAKTLRETLAERLFKISHSESLELIAHVLGCKNWQTLAAAIEARPPDLTGTELARTAILLPVVPVRDIVVLPDMTLPLLVGRAKTLRAIERAMVGDRRLFLVAQKREADEAPTAADLYEIGVVAVILQSIRLPDGTMKVMVQAERRARLRHFIDGELLEGEIEAITTPSSDGTGQGLAREALRRFAHFANHDPAAPPLAMALLPHRVEDPATFADMLTPLVATRLDQAQALLETADPVERLKTLIALMGQEQKVA